MIRVSLLTIFISAVKIFRIQLMISGIKPNAHGIFKMKL